MPDCAVCQTDSLSHSVGRTLRGKVVFEYPIDHVSGKISKKYRTVYNYRKASKRKFTQVRDARTTPPTSKEMALHTKFRTVRLAALERAEDLMHMTQDQASYNEARKASGFKYTTFNGWLFAKAWTKYKVTKYNVPRLFATARSSSSVATRPIPSKVKRSSK